jgi:hypothetical protein
MPGDQAVAREARLVKQVVRWLQTQGIESSIHGWPDRNRGAWDERLTVEAVITLGTAPSQWDWALDVMMIPVPQAVARSIITSREQILPQAASLAGQYRRAVTVSVRFVRDAKQRNAYYEQVLRLVEGALKSGEDYFDESGNDLATHVLLEPGEFISGPDGPTGAVRVHLMFATSTSGDLLAELRETVAGPLGKKLTNQLKRAKDLGYATMLLALDQVGHEALPGGTAWLPSPDAVATVVTELCEAHADVLDAALMATHTGELVQIFGTTSAGRADEQPER